MSQTKTYNLPIGALFALKQLLPTAAWYAEEQQQQARLIVNGVAADEAIGDIPGPPVRQDGETEVAYAQRVRAWASEERAVGWTDRQRDAVKVCVQYYLKKGAFVATTTTVKLLQAVGLGDE